MDTHTQHDPANPINYQETEEDKRIKKNELIFDTLQTLTLEYLGQDATEYIIFTDDLEDYTEDQITQELENNGFFNVDIIYYYNAIEYLKENDTSLSESLEIANEFGYTLENLNSEALASLHASEQRRNKYYEHIQPELEKIINN